VHQLTVGSGGDPSALVRPIDTGTDADNVSFQEYCFVAAGLTNWRFTGTSDNPRRFRNRTYPERNDKSRKRHRVAGGAFLYRLSFPFFVT
jgi:hypothetical protein